MYGKHFQFFQSRDFSHPCAQFVGVKKIPDSILELHRGFEEIPSLMFRFPSLLLGIFGKTFPEVVSMREIGWHKLTNLSNDYHMVSMSTDPHLASVWGQGCSITIDPTLFRQYIVDVHESYYYQSLTLPGRMDRELEHAALGVPFCCIKTMMIKGVEIDNPFYLAIDNDHQEAKQAFNAIYTQFITLLRNKYSNERSDDEEQLALQDFVNTYLLFYEKYGASKNPFNKTIQELLELHPAFMQRFLELNPQLDQHTLMKDLAMMTAGNLFKEHDYTRSLGDVELSQPTAPITFYDDPWARPNYD